MISNFLNIITLEFFLILILNIFLFFLINFFCIKKNILIDFKKSSLHKRFINKDIVPISGGSILLINCLIFDIFTNIENQLFVFIIFLIGFFADFRKLNSPIIRLCLQTAVIVFFVSINDLFIRSIRIPFLDNYLNYNIISILFTSFCLLILINGSNFIDGTNLQCSGYYFGVMTILLYLKFNTFEIYNINIIIVLYPSVFIFILFNYFNKSYLGDGGSYLLSFLIGYLLINFQIKTNVSPYYLALLLWYPAFENLFSILRKIKSPSISPDQPDILHLHHLLFRYLTEKFNLNKNLLSSLPSIVINLFNILVFYIGSQFLYSTIKLAILIVICIIIYVLSYFALKNKFKTKNITL